MTLDTGLTASDHHQVIQLRYSRENVYTSHRYRVCKQRLTDTTCAKSLFLVQPHLARSCRDGEHVVRITETSLHAFQLQVQKFQSHLGNVNNCYLSINQD